MTAGTAQVLGAAKSQGSGAVRAWFRTWYFASIAAILLALTIIGFSDNLFTDIHQQSNSDPKFIVHGLLCGGWMVLLLVQALLVKSRRVALHRRLGVAGMILALGVSLSTVWVFVAVWQGWAAMTPEVIANRILLPSFSVCVLFAWHCRRHPDLHRRLILVGTLFMLDPVLARVYDPMFGVIAPVLVTRPFDWVFPIWLYSLWTALFLSLLAYDWIVNRRLHRISLAGLGWFGLALAVAFTL